jgi:hypothetical protein
VEEGEIGEDADAAVEEAAEGSREKADLAKAQTCYIGRSLMTQADLDALRLEGCFEPETCRLPGRKPRRSPEKMRVWSFGISLPLGFGCQYPRSLRMSWRLIMFRSTS